MTSIAVDVPEPREVLGARAAAHGHQDLLQAGVGQAFLVLARDRVGTVRFGVKGRAGEGRV